MRGSWDEGKGSWGVQKKPNALLTKEMREEQLRLERVITQCSRRNGEVGISSHPPQPNFSPTQSPACGLRPCHFTVNSSSFSVSGFTTKSITFRIRLPMALYDNHFVQDLHILCLCISQCRLGCAAVTFTPITTHPRLNLWGWRQSRFISCTY